MSKREVFRAEGLPVFQNKVFPTPTAAICCERGDVVLVQDPISGLIYNDAYDPSKLVYDQNYQNEQAYSRVFQQHLDVVSGIVSRHFRGKSLIEVGCGKGYFLEKLLADGVEIVGVDPAYEGDSPHVIKGLFSKELGISGECVILRHVLEHVVDPLSFLADIALANGGKGSIYIEVPCLDWICEHHAWFDVFYEHVNYFRLQNFSRMFGRIHESGHIFGGQYLYVIADLSSLRQPCGEVSDRFDFPPDFLSGVEKAAGVARTHHGVRRNAVWGGSSKGVIFSLYMERAGISIDQVIDINPAKQGHYLAAVGLRVSSPDDALGRLSPEDNIFVMNSNYLKEIITMSGNEYSYITVDSDQP